MRVLTHLRSGNSTLRSTVAGYHPLVLDADQEGWDFGRVCGNPGNPLNNTLTPVATQPESRKLMLVCDPALIRNILGLRDQETFDHRWLEKQYSYVFRKSANLEKRA